MYSSVQKLGTLEIDNRSVQILKQQQHLDMCCTIKKRKHFSCESFLKVKQTI